MFNPYYDSPTFDYEIAVNDYYVWGKVAESQEYDARHVFEPGMRFHEHYTALAAMARENEARMLALLAAAN